MTIACPAPDEALGVVLRLSGYLDCQARALGENGFEALTGGPIVSGMLSGAVTIFVALIGYRMILGSVPTLRDGVGWAVRLGLVLALATSWPAFQTLVYRVATDAPAELAATLLPAVGLPDRDVDARIQSAYDAIGRGVYLPDAPSPSPSATAAAPSSNPTPAMPPSAMMGMAASPQTASLLALSSVGIAVALRLVSGLLVAIGPLAILGLLFDGTLGLLSGWVRALAGAALSVFAVTVIMALEIAVVESEIARAGEIQSGMMSSNMTDPQAFTTIVGAFVLASLLAVYASFRAAGGFQLPAFGAPGLSPANRQRGSSLVSSRHLSAADIHRASTERDATPSRTRAAAVSEALVTAARRDTEMADVSAMRSARRATPLNAARAEAPRTVEPLGQTGRRTSIRRTRSAVRRDRPA